MATCIAIRVRATERYIQVIDNGLGMSKPSLEKLVECYNFRLRNKQKISSNAKSLTRIRRLSTAMIISSRESGATVTYTKILKSGADSRIILDEYRPAHGTTVTINGFYAIPLKQWDLRAISFLISNIALNYPKVSISIRDLEEDKLFTAIPRPHNPYDIVVQFHQNNISMNMLWFIKNHSKSEMKFVGYIGWSRKSTGTQRIFVNNKPIHYPCLLHRVSEDYMYQVPRIGRTRSNQTHRIKQVIVLLFVKCDEDYFTVGADNRTVLCRELSSLITSIQKCIIMISPDRYTREINPEDTVMAFPVNHLRNKMRKRLLHFNTKTHEAPIDINDILRDVPLTELNRENNIRKITKADNFKAETSIERKTTEMKFHSTEHVYENLGNSSDETTSPRNHSAMDQLDKICELITPETKRFRKTITENFRLSLSTFSHWSYHSRSISAKKCSLNQIPIRNIFGQALHGQRYKRFDFLPEKLKNLVPNTSKKLTTVKVFNGSGGSLLSIKRRHGFRVAEQLDHQELEVRACKSKKKFSFFRFEKNLLGSIQILGQIFNNLIVGIINEMDRKILVLIDQHAIHERIRYEELLNEYAVQEGRTIPSVRLKEPIQLELSDEICNFVLSREKLLSTYGIRFRLVQPNTVAVHIVPECFVKRKKFFQHENSSMKIRVKNLIDELKEKMETGQQLSNIKLPRSICNAIAAEACHGATKFGDRLTLDQCKSLMKMLKRTKIPTQCAHGRPSIAALLDLSELDNRRQRTLQAKLNLKKLKPLAKGA